MINIDVILIEPETSGNMGAVARIMKNFGFDSLVLINPKCDHLDKEALDRATHAKEILKNTKIVDKNYLKNYDYLIGTTAVLGTDYNLTRTPLTPEQLAEKLKNIKKSKIALIFGREGHGLTNTELNDCDFIVTIPTSKYYPTMNISHSVAIVLYEIFKKSSNKKITDHFIPAGKKEKEIMLKFVNEVLDKMEFQTKEKKQTQKIVWKRFIGKAFLTKREAFAILGFFRKIKLRK